MGGPDWLSEGRSLEMERSYALGIAISLGGLTCFFMTIQGMLQLGFLRPRRWAWRYSTGQLNQWRRRLPGFGFPLGMAVLLGTIAVAVQPLIPRLTLIALAIAMLALALLVGVSDPKWARPAWLNEPGAAEVTESRGEPILLIVGLIELSVMAALYVWAEGLTGFTIGLLVIAAAAGLNAIPRKRKAR